jgi:hypothetical protein
MGVSIDPNSKTQTYDLGVWGFLCEGGSAEVGDGPSRVGPEYFWDFLRFGGFDWHG